MASATSSHGSFCSAYGCSNNKGRNKELGFFRFPPNKEHDRLVKWVVASRRDDLHIKIKQPNYLYNNCRMCSVHFKPNMFNDPARTKLKWNAEPFKCPPQGVRKPPTRRDPGIATFPEEEVEQDLERMRKSIETDHGYGVQAIKPREDDEAPQQLDVMCLADKIVDLQQQLQEKEPEQSYSDLQTVDDIVVAAKCLGMTDQCAEFFRGQLRNSQRKSQGRRWTVTDKGVALGIVFRSRQVYDLLGSLFLLPSVSTLHRFVRGVSVVPGISEAVLRLLETKVASLPELAKYCVITFDEMSLKKELKYDSKTDDVKGLVDLGSKQATPCNQALVFMVKGLCVKWKQPVAFYFSHNAAPANSLKEILLQLIKRLTEIGMHPTAVVCDQGSCNRALYRLLNVDVNRPYFQFNGNTIFALYDVPHILKNIRNTLKKGNIIYSNGKVASWEHVVQFFKADQALPHFVRLAPKLTTKHIFLPPFSPMKVSLAAQVCSNSVYAGMHTLVALDKLPQVILQTANFLKDVNDVFDLLNVRQSGNAALTLDSKQKIGHFREVVSGWQMIGKSTQQPCFIGLLQNLNAMEQLVQSIVTPDSPVKYVLSGRISQDCLENFFSQVRNKGGHRFNPSSEEFSYAYRSLCTDLLLKPVKSANCAADADKLLMSLAALGQNQNRKRKRSENEDDQDSVEPVPKKQKEDNSNEPVVIEDFAVPTIVSNVIAYIGGYLLKKLPCSDCKLTIEEGSLVTEANIYCHFRAYQHATSAFGSLYVPCESLRQVLERIDRLFVESIPKLICISGILKSLMDKVESNVPIMKLLEHALCSKHRDVDSIFVKAMIKLYLRCRIHYYFRFETRKLLLRPVKKNRKAQVLMNQ